MRRALIEWINGYLPPERQIASSRPVYNNILLIAATNRADSLDPALMRPGGSTGVCTSTCRRRRNGAS